MSNEKKKRTGVFLIAISAFWMFTAALVISMNKGESPPQWAYVFNLVSVLSVIPLFAGVMLILRNAGKGGDGSGKGR